MEERLGELELDFDSFETKLSTFSAESYLATASFQGMVLAALTFS